MRPVSGILVVKAAYEPPQFVIAYGGIMVGGEKSHNDKIHR